MKPRNTTRFEVSKHGNTFVLNTFATENDLTCSIKLDSEVTLITGNVVDGKNSKKRCKRSRKGVFRPSERDVCEGGREKEKRKEKKELSSISGKGLLNTESSLCVTSSAPIVGTHRLQS
jgi:hypothetical protein